MLPGGVPAVAVALEEPDAVILRIKKKEKQLVSISGRNMTISLYHAVFKMGVFLLMGKAVLSKLIVM